MTYDQWKTDSGQNEITPEQEREIEAREECERQGIDPDAECADGGVMAWMIVAQELAMKPSAVGLPRTREWGDPDFVF